MKSVTASGKPPEPWQILFEPSFGVFNKREHALNAESLLTFCGLKVPDDLKVVGSERLASMRHVPFCKKCQKLRLRRRTWLRKVLSEPTEQAEPLPVKGTGTDYLEGLRTSKLPWTQIERVFLSTQLTSMECVRPISADEATQLSSWNHMGPENLTLLAKHGIHTQADYIRSLTGKLPHKDLTYNAVIQLVHIRQRRSNPA